MRLNRTVLAGMVLAGVTALFFIGGCTGTSTRADLEVTSVNEGNTYYSDLRNEVDSLKPFTPVDQIPVTFGNHPHDGGTPVAPGAAFGEIVVDHYHVTYNNGIFSPVDGGMNVVVASGGTTDASITISDPSEKAALFYTLASTVTATAKIDFFGYVRTSGNYGDRVYATAYVTVQVDNFGDTDVNK
ncbi:MAG TPA: hypothetical protein VK527_05450 [Candidatus Limnocylindrales bacterium]|nr:hypothetical protein [Candidatus Limnocylindrales bacterium]